MTEDESPPPNWTREDPPSALRSAAAAEYVDFRHDTGDVRVRLVPPAAGDEHHGYGVSVTVYPYTDLERGFDVRRVSSKPRARAIAGSFMDLFDGHYDRNGDVEAAVTYALARTRPADTVDVTVTFDETEGIE